MHIRFNTTLVKNLRAHFKLSQRELGTRAGMHYTTINNIEQGKCCSFESAARLASYFKCDPMQLLISEGQPPKNHAFVESLK
jgi:DNA-binding XRE family transcriptional regulator